MNMQIRISLLYSFTKKEKKYINTWKEDLTPQVQWLQQQQRWQLPLAVLQVVLGAMHVVWVVIEQKNLEQGQGVAALDFL